MSKPKKTTPRKPAMVREAAVPRHVFASEADERAYWQQHDTVGMVDWSHAVTVQMPNLKPSTTTISLRLPDAMLAELRQLANQWDVPYQSLLKTFLADRLAAERMRAR
jgi:predicted DNA binding CopG/RHH family protein